jgi:poly-gamma-glutamate synthesis protein (capsule biosynthesis protein)
VNPAIKRLHIRKHVAIVLSVILAESLFILFFVIQPKGDESRSPTVHMQPTIHINEESVNNPILPRPFQLSLAKMTTLLPEVSLDHKSEIVFSLNAEGMPVYSYVYAAVVPFGSLRENTSLDDIRIMYDTKTYIQAFSQAYYLNGTENTISHILGISKVEAIGVDRIEQLLEVMTEDSIALIPFETLIPQLKTLNVDGLSILDTELTNEQWPLSLTIFASGDKASEFPIKAKRFLLPSNRLPNDWKTLIMTGVTAITRGVEYEIEKRNDPIFPARGVMDVLEKADITHVNSENPLFDDCIPPTEGVVLCGKTRSIANYEAIGVDIVGLTGNHRNDWGPEKNLESIENLEERDYQYYGGGKNEEDAGKILYLDLDGFTLAFVGYAYFDSLNGPEYVSLAYQDRPGANFFSQEKLERDIIQAKKEADFVIVEYQFIENYSYEPIPGQIEVFQQTIDLGADLVMGVQAHQPQWIRFHERLDGTSGMIFYGLGNFFFDQMWSLGTRQGIIPRFIFDNGQLIQAEVMTTLLYDYAQPRFVEGNDRTAILTEVLP